MCVILRHELEAPTSPKRQAPAGLAWRFALVSVLFLRATLSWSIINGFSAILSWQNLR